MTSSSNGTDKFVVRLPKGMRDKINQAAHKARRSMNAEIIRRLELSFFEASASEESKEPLEVSPSEATLIQYFRSMPEEKREAVLKLIRE